MKPIDTKPPGYMACESHSEGAADELYAEYEDDHDHDHSTPGMSDARQAAQGLRLPLFWFTDHRVRTRYRIPHYELGRLVRFRMQELEAWVAQNKVSPRPLGAQDADETGLAQ